MQALKSPLRLIQGKPVTEPSIRTAGRKTLSKKGTQRRKQILAEATDIFINRGYGELSVRNVAKAAGISVGNLCYYFPSKESLLHAMLDAIMDQYNPILERVVANASDDPHDRFCALVEYLIRDLGNDFITKFFPELWALSNHEPVVAEMVESIYQFERDHLYRAVHALRPDMKKKRKMEITLFISASIEGMTIFIGKDKSQNHMMNAMLKTALTSYLHLLEIE
jgi:AcrR family transcriptional regulator